MCTVSSPRQETYLSTLAVESSGDNFIFALYLATIADAGELNATPSSIVGDRVECPKINATTLKYFKGTILDNNALTKPSATKDVNRRR